jgi:GNAT superfamily N-acetyltransferase
MPTVIHLRKQLQRPPVAAALPGIVVRKMSAPGDISAWLALRDRAMARQIPGVRSWTTDDFRAEMTAKPWWREGRMWLAFGNEPPGPLVGSVTLAIREGAAHSVPVVHWLLVDPAWRRRGVARLLMSHLESAAWNDGWREVQLETHSGWSAAVALYHSMGYVPLRDPSPR